jgi:hypothetical protein
VDNPRQARDKWRQKGKKRTSGVQVAMVRTGSGRQQVWAHYSKGSSDEVIL